MAEMWGQVDRVSSKMTPRLQANWEGGIMAASPMMMGKVGGDGVLYLSGVDGLLSIWNNVILNMNHNA